MMRCGAEGISLERGWGSNRFLRKEVWERRSQLQASLGTDPWRRAIVGGLWGVSGGRISVAADVP